MIDIYSTPFLTNLVRGYTWKARMFNGAVFKCWTPGVISRKKAREIILRIANGDYGKIYSEKDIKQLWFNKNVKK